MSHVKKEQSKYVFFKRNRKRMARPPRSFCVASRSMRAALVEAATQEK